MSRTELNELADLLSRRLAILDMLVDAANEVASDNRFPLALQTALDDLRETLNPVMNASAVHIAA
jgi:hypothetical protein